METQVDEKKSPILRFIDALSKVIEFFCVLCLAGQVVIIGCSVFGRYVLNSSPSWSEEISRLLMIWMSLLTVALAVKDGTHVRITFLDRLFKGKALVIRDVIYSLLNISFCAVLFWKGIDLTMQAHKTRLPASGLPTSIMYASVCAGGVCMLIMLIYKLGERICQRK